MTEGRRVGEVLSTIVSYRLWSVNLGSYFYDNVIIVAKIHR